EIVCHRAGALLRQLHVVVVASARIGVPDDPEPGLPESVAAQRLAKISQRYLRIVRKARAVIFECDPQVDERHLLAIHHLDASAAPDALLTAQEPIETSRALDLAAVQPGGQQRVDDLLR